ncbi:BmGPI16, Chemotaxis domain [Babesia microti strain RI]|uniref:BmGPI16, Chemotaxis domain n=1 Tax=Babesia microti (strain RI) TaxID=1133968 RepID=A0A0K3AR98_BABMR|nr:BmGPI16, Chemotaxis domain [Babesia microti strain RI]CTQ41168.1 BmGPI16, Chemotaxis domain [Babesia microti strain RI]|eukprot:XP_012649179.1 BmGPI16, Chemotaxis domain [Babesia microti strain RI]
MKRTKLSLLLHLIAQSLITHTLSTLVDAATVTPNGSANVGGAELTRHAGMLDLFDWLDPTYHSFTEYFAKKRKLTSMPYTFVDAPTLTATPLLNDQQLLPGMNPNQGQVTKACVNPSMIQMANHPNCAAIIKHFQDSLMKLKNEYKGKSDLAGSEFQESKHTPIGVSSHFEVNNEFDNKLHDNNSISAPTEIAAENSDAEFHGASEILNVPLAVSHSFYKVSITLTGLEAIRKGMFDINKKGENTISEQRLDSVNKRKISLEYALSSSRNPGDPEVNIRAKKLEREAELATYKALAGVDSFNKCKTAFSALLPLLQQQISNIEYQYNSCIGSFGQMQNFSQDNASKPLTQFSFDASMSQGLNAMDSDLNMIQNAISDITHDSIKSNHHAHTGKKKCCKKRHKGGRMCNRGNRRVRGINGINYSNLSFLPLVASFLFI